MSPCASSARWRIWGRRFPSTTPARESAGMSATSSPTSPGTPAKSKPILSRLTWTRSCPGEGIVPILDGDILRTDGRTVLGGDDKSGVAIICEVLRVVKENRFPCSDVDVVFTICEEAGLIGAKCLDVNRLRARTGLVLDSDSVGFLFTKAPAANRMEFQVHGLEAHAGVCPEKGVNAIKVAADGVARMSLGRIDHETTANIGVIEGGMAVNIVPNSVILKGEARSHSQEKLERQTETHATLPPRRCGPSHSGGGWQMVIAPG